MGIVMLAIGLLGSLVGVVIFGWLGLMMWRLGLRKRDFSAFMTAVGVWCFALVIASVGASIVAAHFDVMQLGRSAFDIATFSIVRLYAIFGGVFFLIGLLTAGVQFPPAKPRN